MTRDWIARGSGLVAAVALAVCACEAGAPRRASATRLAVTTGTIAVDALSTTRLHAILEAAATNRPHACDDAQFTRALLAAVTKGTPAGEMWWAMREGMLSRKVPHHHLDARTSPRLTDLVRDPVWTPFAAPVDRRSSSACSSAWHLARRRPGCPTR